VPNYVYLWQVAREKAREARSTSVMERIALYQNREWNFYITNVRFPLTLYSRGSCLQATVWALEVCHESANTAAKKKSGGGASATSVEQDAANASRLLWALVFTRMVAGSVQVLQDEDFSAYDDEAVSDNEGDEEAAAHNDASSKKKTTTTTTTKAKSENNATTKIARAAKKDTALPKKGAAAAATAKAEQAVTGGGAKKSSTTPRHQQQAPRRTCWLKMRRALWTMRSSTLCLRFACAPAKMCSATTRSSRRSCAACSACLCRAAAP
jgi:hypothetical protein